MNSGIMNDDRKKELLLPFVQEGALNIYNYLPQTSIIQNAQVILSNYKQAKLKLNQTLLSKVNT